MTSWFLIVMVVVNNSKIMKKIMKNKKLLFIMILAWILVIPDTMTQSLTYTSTGDSHITVIGTSSLHDWELHSETLMSEAVFSTGNGETLESLESVIFILEKTTLESERSRLQRMAHEEMDAENHPEITFRSNDNGTIQRNGDEYEVTATGDLTISGVTRRISVEATCINGADEIVCAGTKDLQMTDFDIDPPTLMFGTIRTHDEVTVEFRMVYTQ